MATATWQAHRSVTPAINNLRYSGGAAVTTEASEPYSSTVRSMTPNNNNNSNAVTPTPETPSSTGLIRLSLKKPMGIVFEPMYDPNQTSIQRGVRICDLPRTGAAALSRKLQVGDELLQINETTVSRLTFDEIMDFIIEADPESVNLLFRRPRKETLQARQGVQQKLNAAANKDNPSTVKWVDEDAEGGGKKSKKKSSSPKKKKDSKKTITTTSNKRSGAKKTPSEDEDATLQSKSTAGEDSYVPKKARRKKSSRTRRNPYETESFLDMLIDTICSDPNNVCRDTFRRADDDYPSDDESFGTEEDETYATYEESLEGLRNKKKGDDKPQLKKKYEDDGTLETVETRERPADAVPPPESMIPPLGLAPNPPPPLRGGEDTDDDTGIPAPIKELEYDDRIDHGADVSVMESLGGPSLLIEKQRAAQAAAAQQTVPPEILEKYGLDFCMPGMTREQSISAEPLRYYTHVVKQLLEQHEPEKVRLLDKLLAKYKSREDHLVQKLAVRYSKDESNTNLHEESFSEAVKKNKLSANAQTTVNTAKERLQQTATANVNHHHHHHDDEEDEHHDHNVEVSNDWPAKETKEPDEGDEDASESGSDYSRDSVDGTSPAVIAQVSELLNYVYGKTSVPGQIDRVSTIMRAYEGREAVLLELLETKALIKANKEKENADSLPSFLRNSQLTQAQKNAREGSNNVSSSANGLPPVTPMATNPEQGGTVINDDISSMSGVSSPAAVEVTAPVEAPLPSSYIKASETSPVHGASKTNSSSSSGGLSKQSKPPPTPDKRKKKGLFGGLFGKKNKKAGDTSISSGSPARPNSRLRPGRNNKLKGVRSVEGSI